MRMRVLLATALVGTALLGGVAEAGSDPATAQPARPAPGTPPAGDLSLVLSIRALAISPAPLTQEAEVERMTAPARTALSTNEACHLEVPTAAVAEMFGLNLTVWRNDPWVTAHHASLVDGLPERLAALTSSTRDDEIAWNLRQVVLSHD